MTAARHSRPNATRLFRFLRVYRRVKIKVYAEDITGIAVGASYRIKNNVAAVLCNPAS